ncbi:hypothetical protein SCLCIDRAFT_1217802 [Scleroderma citrinum Foug A]|uniref:Uncharacterized protein n=1 Tax=Scleroderma citrinum Foug A TaxID=1036808 RepID=A0A0C3DTB5_9AGAM|nr:hypothetical protein SCLCIDRAFT_1217802 [Scleroderma citrinum Foug A]
METTGVVDGCLTLYLVRDRIGQCAASRTCTGSQWNGHESITGSSPTRHMFILMSSCTWSMKYAWGNMTPALGTSHEPYHRLQCYRSPHPVATGAIGVT